LIDLTGFIFIFILKLMENIIIHKKLMKIMI